MLIGSIEIARYLDCDDRDVVLYRAIDGANEELGLVETLGMLELTKDTAVRGPVGESVDR